MTRRMTGESWTVPAVVALTILAALLRVPLMGIGVWRDEAYTYFDVTQATVRGTIEHIARVETNPPLFFLLERVMGSLFGFGELALKLLPLLCGIALVPATFVLASALAARRPALLATFLAATAEIAIYYSQELRPYTLAALLLVLTANAYVRWLAERGRPWWALWALALAYTHYVGIIALAGMIVGTCYLRAADRPPLARLVLPLLALSAAFLPWLPFLVQQLRAGTPWVDFPVWAARPASAVVLMSYTFPGYLRSAAAGFLFAYVALVGVAGYVLVLHARLRKPDERSAQDAGTFVLAVCVVWVVACEAVLGYRDQRYVFPILALAIVVYARILDEIATALAARARVPALAGLVLGFAGLLCAATSVHPTVYLARQPKSGMQEAGATLAEGSLRDAAILVAPGYAAASCAFYAQGRTVYGFPRWNDPQDFDIVAETAAWFGPDPVERTLDEVARLAAHGTAQLAVVRPTALARPFGKSGILPYQLTDVLTGELDRRYAIVQRFDYPANVEWVSMIVYDLRNPKE
jgi:4-amino-4-deoxy-L-arabinose transferase-like glycosyltransferase